MSKCLSYLLFIYRVITYVLMGITIKLLSHLKYTLIASLFFHLWIMPSLQWIFSGNHTCFSQTKFFTSKITQVSLSILSSQVCIKNTIIYFSFGFVICNAILAVSGNQQFFSQTNFFHLQHYTSIFYSFFKFQ